MTPNVDRVFVRYPVRFPQMPPYIISIMDALRGAMQYRGTEEYRIVGEEAWMTGSDLIERVTGVIISDREQQEINSYTTGQRIDERGRVVLYRELIEDLSLEPGDMIYFNKDKSGRWAIYTEDEAEETLEEALSEA